MEIKLHGAEPGEDKELMAQAGGVGKRVRAQENASFDKLPWWPGLVLTGVGGARPDSGPAQNLPTWPHTHTIF